MGKTPTHNSGSTLSLVFSFLPCASHAFVAYPILCLWRSKLFLSPLQIRLRLETAPKTSDHILCHRHTRNRRRQVLQSRSKSKMYRAKMPGKPYRSTAGRLRAPLGCRGREFESRHSDGDKPKKVLEIIAVSGTFSFWDIRFCGAADHRGGHRQAGILRDSFSGLFGSRFVRFGVPCLGRLFFVFCGGGFAGGAGLIRLSSDGGNRTPNSFYDVGVCSFLFCLFSAILALTSAIIAASAVSHSSGVPA